MKRGRLSQGIRDQIRRLLHEGKNPTEISESINRSLQAVQRYVDVITSNPILSDVKEEVASPPKEKHPDLFLHNTATNKTPGISIMTQAASERYDSTRTGNRPINNPAIVAKAK